MIMNAMRLQVVMVGSDVRLREDVMQFLKVQRDDVYGMHNVSD